MAGSSTEETARRAVLNDLASELNRPGGPGARLRRTLRLVPYLSIRTAPRGRMRVYCAGAGGQYALLTSDGQLISLAAGTPAAAQDIARACGRAAPGRAASGHATTRQGP